VRLMFLFIAKRLLWMIPSLLVISILSFVLIRLPPGDFVTNYIATLAASNEIVDQNTAADLRARFGLDQPMIVQYWRWISSIVFRGDFGFSFEWQQPVGDLIWERMGLTLLLTLSTLLVTWAIALPVGVYSAVKKYSLGDYLATFFSFLGLAVPSFLLALVLMYVAAMKFGQDVGGLFSEEYLTAPWSFGKALDLLSHIWIAVVILAVSGTASLIRIMRANMLDELGKPYVTTARAKGLSEFRLLVKYPVRLALNPFISTIAWLLPNLVSGSIIVAIVLNLPTAGPLLLQSLMSQDMYLAGAFVLLICALTLVGTLISDVLLALADPRIRLD
jgi:peptide/nickel transport system permease protein